MIRPLALYIGLRYTRAKRRNRFISFIAFASILGIAIGMTVLITVLSVINGFDEQIRNRFFAIAPQVTVLTGKDITSTWPQLAMNLRRLPEVQALAPFVSGQGMIMNQGVLRGVNVVGIIPDKETSISKLSKQIIAGGIDTLQPGRFNVMIGKALAEQLELQLGDSVSIFTAQDGSFQVLPRFDYQTFTISAIFTSSQGFGFDQVLVYTNMADAQTLLAQSEHISGLHLKLTNLYQAGLVNQELRGMVPRDYVISDWTEQFGGFFQTLAMQKTMLFVILLFIVAIAAFNLVSTLILVVNEKRADIAILRTLGATPAMIMNTFIIQGALIGLAGAICGIIGGVLLSLNITGIANGIQNLFHVQLISESVYFVNYLPSKIMLEDIVQVCAIAFGLSVLAAIYPALVAFRTQPAEALRYE